MRHGVKSRYARQLKRFGGMDEDHTKENFNQLVQRGQERKKKVEKVKRVGKDQGESDSDSGSYFSSDEDKARKQAEDMIREEMSDESSEGEDSEDSDGDVIMQFKDNTQSKKKKEKKKEGIQGMKFMRKADIQQKARLKEEGELLIKEIRQTKAFEDSEDEVDSDAEADVVGKTSTSIFKKNFKPEKEHQENLDVADTKKILSNISKSQHVEEEKPQAHEKAADSHIDTHLKSTTIPTLDDISKKWTEKPVAG